MPGNKGRETKLLKKLKTLEMDTDKNLLRENVKSVTGEGPGKYYERIIQTLKLPLAA